MHFEFTHTHEWTEENYVDINRIFWKKKQWLKIFIYGVFGILCLFWTYTFLLGVFLILLFAIFAWAPYIFVFGSGVKFRECPFLQEAITYGVSNERLWLNNSLIEASVPWETVDVWDERDGWLLVAPTGLPELWFPISKLKDAGLYPKIIVLCKKNGVLFNSRAAKSKRLSRRFRSPRNTST